MKVTVFGIGYVGLVQATVFAEVGHDVLCVDVDAKKVENLKNGQIPIFEPGLVPLVKKNYTEGRLNFTTDAKAGVAHGKLQFIAVGTPPDEDGSADLQYVTAVAHTIAENMDGYKVVVDKSTVPVGTADKVRAVMQTALTQRSADFPFDVVSNPEFLKEGAAISDCMRPERIIIGCDNDNVIDVMRELYEPFNRNHDRMIVMDIRSAELTKYAANCMLATKISFMNEIANLAEMLGADIEHVRQGIGSDPRIGYHFIYPGCGYGGSCFPKDVQALIRTSEQIGYTPKILQAVELVNEKQKSKLPTFVKRHFGDDLSGKTFAIWGLSFKPNTDDMREASSRVLMEALWESGAKVQAYDPEAMQEAQRIYGQRDDLSLMGTKEAALKGADALIICTEWQNFRAPDFDIMKDSMKSPIIFDGRNLYDPERLQSRGFTYYGIGRGASINPVV
ncbi:UDP-glucose/GDP-mannose dehydrogenase family protein [Xenorhabdus bovienii]|uniref:UDP-glucose dehydrogenase family protein n=1 Tax=Xenorhabdus bovienii TaxID=40576 RepID=UPI0023B250F2|nr:UDP-glucose/GDP-mannose dehydrogenase family protein [Xenorhabdus bovienii]MDE9494476.1 UDP-glucose/GDP-mannose dehydrogenase family protein [Xenorhabdus bovienii]MDE9500706.1 UDP-glucose/GDP-mannose dehydrogenase family protein [Xenorhabdus bovienii]MDE9516236.1 UDP-glucose/GDP-mannose dehydrogenase family protein [Xenorhabdus bovienii]MDE9526523.1 UDP-glucose/GDP-mannose dehydrogenase family protein [Xenorhabdus bovienii]MDE9569938.1 UDP-glucose/GDP-mannose dehydrogenase family protein [X